MGLKRSEKGSSTKLGYENRLLMSDKLSACETLSLNHDVREKANPVCQCDDTRGICIL